MLGHLPGKVPGGQGVLPPNDERDWGGEAPGRRTRPKAEAKGRGCGGAGAPAPKIFVTTVTTTTSWILMRNWEVEERSEGGVWV